MNRRFLGRRAVAIGVFGLAVALAVPVIAKSVAGADPSEAVPPVQPQHVPAQHVPAQPAQAQPVKAQAARSIVYGTATETTFTVYRQSLPQGTPEVLFSYENLDDPGYPEQGLEDPELALSPDGRSVAYFSRSGLRVRHLDTGADNVVIGRSEPPPGGDGDDAPIWTLEELNAPADEDPKDYYTAAMFSLHDIAFSPDGRFLSFAGNWYEYHDHWVIELATGRHWRDNGSTDLAWSPSSDRVAVAGPWYADPGELAVSAPGDLGRYTPIRPVPNAASDLSYEDVEFAPGGNRIAFTYAYDRSWPAPEKVGLATSNVDGTGFAALDASGTPEAFAFAADGTSLYSVRREQGARSYVAIHSLAGGSAQGFASLPPDFASTLDMWVTPSGELAVIGQTTPGNDGTFSQRMLLFSPLGHLLESTPSFAQDTRLIGIG